MYSFGLPILEYDDQRTTMLQCQSCKVPLQQLEPKEELFVVVGDHALTALAYIPKARCPQCGDLWESPSARIYRSEAINRRINDFWQEKMRDAKVDYSAVQRLKEAARKLVGVGDRPLAGEFGKWLAGCAFLE